MRLLDSFVNTLDKISRVWLDEGMEWILDEFNQATAQFGAYELVVGPESNNTDEFMGTYWASVNGEIHPATRWDQSYWDEVASKDGFPTLSEAKAWARTWAQAADEAEQKWSEQMLQDLEDEQRHAAEWSR
jgi:hypothetical protein